MRRDSTASNMPSRRSGLRVNNNLKTTSLRGLSSGKGSGIVYRVARLGAPRLEPSRRQRSARAIGGCCRSSFWWRGPVKKVETLRAWMGDRANNVAT